MATKKPAPKKAAPKKVTKPTPKKAVKAAKPAPKKAVKVAKPAPKKVVKAAKPAPKKVVKPVPKKVVKAAKPEPKKVIKVAKPAPKKAIKVAKPSTTKIGKASKPEPKKTATTATKSVPSKNTKETKKPILAKAKATKETTKPIKKETTKPEKPSAPAKVKAEKPVKQAVVKEPKEKKSKKKEVVKKIIISPIVNAPKKIDAFKTSTFGTSNLKNETGKVIAHRKTSELKRKTEDLTNTKKYIPELSRSILDMNTNNTTSYRYSDEDLQEFKELIQRKLDVAKAELQYLQGVIMRKDESGTEDTENKYQNMEDGSASMDREQFNQLASRQITFISHLEQALVRIENKTYGICRETGKLIDKARLRAVPHATLSIEAKNAKKN